LPPIDLPAPDTSASTVKLASPENYAHVLCEFSSEELRKVADVSTKRSLCVSSEKILHYKEIQIHGPLRFDRDIEAIVVSLC